MVSGRRGEFFRSQSQGTSYDSKYRDLESGDGTNGNLRPRQRFRDAVQATITKGRAEDLKRKLLEGVDHDALEKFRKSDEEVCPLHTYTPRSKAVG